MVRAPSPRAGHVIRAARVRDGRHAGVVLPRVRRADRTSAALAERAAAGPDKELVKQWKAMGIKVDKDGNPITAASKRGPKQAEPAAQKKGKGLFGLF